MWPTTSAVVAFGGRPTGRSCAGTVCRPPGVEQKRRARPTWPFPRTEQDDLGCGQSRDRLASPIARPIPPDQGTGNHATRWATGGWLLPAWLGRALSTARVRTGATGTSAVVLRLASQGSAQATCSARSLIPRSIFWLITKLTASTGSTRNRAHGRVYAYLSRTSSRDVPSGSSRSTQAQVKS